MHYFQWNIKSYQAATAHLSNEEDLAYRRLIELYYDTEQPIPSAIPVLSRRLRVGTPVLENVLKEFFVLTENGWKNEYCDTLIHEYHAFKERQRINGSKGGRGNKADAKPEKATGKPDKPSAKPTINHKPLTTNQLNISDATASSSPSPKVDPIPYQKIIETYHAKLPTLPKLLKLSTKRKAQIGARWRSGDLPDLETWGEYFDFVAKSDFLMGRTEPEPGRKRFIADLEWLTNESNFTKTYERKYHGR